MDYRLITKEWEKEQFIIAWEAAFNQRLHRDMAAWLFHHNENSMYGVFDGDKVVAGYCLLNQWMVLNGRVVKGALCNNVFVHPEYQGLKLFTTLGSFSLGQAASQGIEMAIGIPNKNAVPGHKRVGWTFLDEIHFLEKKREKGQETGIPVEIQPLNKINYPQYKVKLEQLSYRLAQQRTFSVIKDRVFFQWRYLEKPLVHYKILMYLQDDEPLGYGVYKYYEPTNRLHIVDMEAANEAVFKGLIQCCDGFEESFERVNVWDSSIYRRSFLDAGFVKSTETNHLIAIQPYSRQMVTLGEEINIVLGDNEVF